MDNSKAINLRVTDIQADKLEEIAEATGVDRSGLLRGLIDALITRWNETQKIVLPFALEGGSNG